MKYCFDFDNTLYNLQAPSDACVDKFIKEDINKEEFFNLTRKYNEEMFPLQQAGKLTYHYVLVTRIHKACEDLGVDTSQFDVEEFIQYYQESQNKIQISDLYKEYFTNTKNEIAILTNGDHKRQTEKLTAAGVLEYIPHDHVFTSGQLGYPKPDARIFQKMAQNLHSSCEEWTYIGDNYEVDMVGAKGAGLRTIHFNRHHLIEGDCSDYVVYSEQELIDLLKKLEDVA